MQLSIIAAITVGLILAKWLAELWLTRLNRRHVLAHAGAVPEAFKEIIGELSFTKHI